MKKRIFSGMQPSGCMTLGNYLGAIKNWATLQDEYDCFYCIVDLHALTVRQNPEEFRERALSLLAQYIACGLDSDKNTLFFQSHVSGHAELAWILNCFTYMGELQRMTQFKDKSQKHADNINAGLFTYPVLMAADILLYNADLVPIGADQKQHLELSRDIAIRFNKIFGDTFTVPEGYFGKVGTRIMSLTDPTKKMSKSDENPKGFISIIDEPDKIMKKFKSAVTDSENIVEFREGKDGINNLLNIYCAVTGDSIENAVESFRDGGYGKFKMAVGEAVVDALRPIQEKYRQLMDDRGHLESIYRKGAEAARIVAEQNLRTVYDKIGLVK